MNLLLVADGHYYIEKNGDVYVESVFDYSFYSRYLSTFEEVYAIVRAENVDVAPSNSKLASGNNVRFLPIPASRGVKEYLKNYLKDRKLIKQYIKEFDCAIFRVPGVVANTVQPLFSKTKKPYAIEVIVDPWEYYSKGTVKSITRPLVRLLWTYSLKKMCLDANGVSYVTKQYLQEKYPCKAILNDEGSCFTTSYSSVELPDDSFCNPRTYTSKSKYIISHVANAFTGYGKGHVTLMKAAKIVLENGYDIDVWFIGDGTLRPTFESISHDLGISEHVKFLGRMPSGDKVREKIRESDLFVFPTMAEGLPRVVLEAMAEGLPVISSPVCGIPEILPKECLVEYYDYQKYAKAIINMINSPETMTSYSRINLEVSKNFSNSILTAKRNVFYGKLRSLAENEC